MISELPEEQREQIRARDRLRYRSKRDALRANPDAMERFREQARSANRRYREKHRDEPGRREWAAAKAKERRDATRDALNAKARARYAANGEQIRARNRAYYWKNRERRAAYNKARYEALAVELRAAQRRRNRNRFEADPGSVLAYNREWRRRNPERARLYVRLSGHKRRRAAGSAHWTPAEWVALVASHAGRCHYCGTDGPMHADHRVPLSRGGPNTIDNIVPSCRSCNSRKHDRTEEEFRAYLKERPRARSRPA